ncbi:response regulator [Pelagicoccus sp. SDUM812003]|uniref:hybrid sensor histidine kinase/response regulator n=1 Tax=Pelagicoccus sp. SDUM812003 TaxID=3041267 RepID=UPI00280DE476|nr:response regulator [Pelagicoccus sp. SDUM812003]MDQ8205269.1 response regulator [Pelagicoccus sp. SDUM812003]
MIGRMGKGLWKRVEDALSELSLKRKIASILVMSGGIVAMVTVVSLAVFELVTARRDLIEDYRSLSPVLRSFISPAIEFKRADDAKEPLVAFRKQGDLLYGEVRYADGQLLVSSGTLPMSVNLREVDQDVTISYFDALIVARYPIHYEDALNGSDSVQPQAYVYLVGDLSEQYWRFGFKAGFIALTLIIGGIVVFIVSARLSRVVTQPILELSDTLRRISREQDFSQRQAKAHDDEVGHLVDSFNEMMQQIERRDDIIRANEERFRGYFELGIVGMAILDENGSFMEANGQLCRQLQVDYGKLLSSRFDDWLDTGPQGEERGFAGICDRCSPGYSGEFWLRGDEERNIYVIVSIRRVRSARSDAGCSYLALFQDITDRKKGEEELLASKRAAEEANRSKDEFLSVMSHELRTPLNPIIGFVDLMMQSDLDAERQGMLRSIRRSSEHLLTLITDILEFTRAQAGRMVALKEPIDLRELCENVVEMMARSGTSRGVSVSLRRFDLDCLPRGMAIESDEGKIRQIALNLLSNAVKYNREQGQVWLDACLFETDAGYRLRMSVEDSGQGIAEEKLEYIFEPFTQLDMSLQRRHEGVGLGLSICRRIIDCLGGRMEVSSQLGVGSTFQFEIPVALVESCEVGPPEPEGEESESMVAFDFASSCRVLVVEDDVENKRLVAANLAQMGVAYEWAENGLVALEKLKQDRYDLVLMDIRMPLMDGLEATRVIREGENGERRVPIVAMTAHVTAGMREECVRVGMDGYISKPVRFEQLETYVRRYLAS